MSAPSSHDPDERLGDLADALAGGGAVGGAADDAVPGPDERLALAALNPGLLKRAPRDALVQPACDCRIARLPQEVHGQALQPEDRGQERDLGQREAAIHKPSLTLQRCVQSRQRRQNQPHRFLRVG